MANNTDRVEFLATLGATLGDATTPEEVTAAYELARNEGRPLGNSANWQGACDWLTANYDEATSADRRKWAVVEGSTLLAYANT
ncbi:hypothetical protein [Streptomyces sp. H27-C3]|uniref:hypothetical protein n=1 Tax=Streptomyces sp. H27-C3 TaxID=3046305 RepID=UPI0024B949D4|nr:hypothetical protein [Streptomyces sp. H27-C3]MDJ0461987.1 hypothetical protein [Streptomyces sp. H27-C3]